MPFVLNLVLWVDRHRGDRLPAAPERVSAQSSRATAPRRASRQAGRVGRPRADAADLRRLPRRRHLPPCPERDRPRDRPAARARGREPRGLPPDHRVDRRRLRRGLRADRARAGVPAAEVRADRARRGRLRVPDAPRRGLRRRAALRGGRARRAVGDGASQSPFVGLVMSLGAGFYEELAFRVLLFGLGAKVLVWLFAHQPYGVVGIEPSGSRSAGLLVALVWALVAASMFSGVHYVGALGDPFAPAVVRLPPRARAGAHAHLRPARVRRGGLGARALRHLGARPPGSLMSDGMCFLPARA